MKSYKSVLLLFFISNFIYPQLEEIDFNAGKAKLNGENKVLELSESVEIYFNDFFLQADEINLDSSKEILSGKNISFDLIDRNAYGKADEILIQKDKAQFKGVEMSLCPCKKRIWWVETDELSFSSQEDFGNFQGGRFYIYDTPIFLLPAGKFPLTTEKRSGILLPELSYSNKNGFDLEIPYYLNLASNYDMTISPRYIEERGLAFSSNLRYLTKSSSGSLNFSSLFNDVNYERLFNTDSNRWGISFKHTGEITDSLYIDIDYSNVSDFLYIRDLGSDLYGDEKTVALPQNLNLSWIGESASIQVRAFSFKLIDPLSQNQFRSIPEVSFDYILPHENIIFSLNGEVANYEKGGSFVFKETKKVQAGKLNLRLGYKFSSSAFDARIFLTNNTHYVSDSADTSFNTKGMESRFILNLAKSNEYLKPFFNFSFKRTDDGKFVNPIYLVSRIPFASIYASSLDHGYANLNKNQLQLGLLWERSQQSSFTSLTFGLKRSLGKSEIGFLDSLHGNKLTLHDLPEPIFINWRWDKKNIDLNGNFQFDEDKDFSSFDLRARFAFQDNKYFSFEYLGMENRNSYLFNQLPEEKLSFLTSGFDVRLEKNWSLVTKLYYDFEIKKVTDNLIGLEYEDEGLLIGFAFRQSKEPDWRKMFLEQNRFQDQLYPEYSQEGIRIYLELKGLGSVGQKINQYIKPLKLQ